MKPILCAFVCFIRSFEPSRTRLNKLFAYPLIKLLEIQWISQHGSFSSYCLVGVCAILKEVVQANDKFLPALRDLWWATIFLFRKSFFMPLMFLIPIAHWTII